MEFRAIKDAKPGTFEAIVMRYNVMDDYRTKFAPKVFHDSLEQRLPRIVWGHDWTDPIGRWVDKDDNRTRLKLRGELDLDMIETLSADGETVTGTRPAVPRAHQAYSQLRTGTIDQFSVGFWPEDGKLVEERADDGEDDYYFLFTRARLDEVSLVLVGAVPNTQLVGVRSYHILSRGPALISKDKAAAVLLKLTTGEMDLADALTAIKEEPEDVGGFEDEHEHQEPPPEEQPPVEEPPEEAPVEQPPAEEPTLTPVEEPPAEPTIEEQLSDQLSAEIEALWADADAVLAKYP